MSLLIEDRPLLDAFRRGDSAALTRVYRVYSPEVAKFLSSGLRVGPIDLDAVHQETFVRAFSPKLRQSYDGLRPYKAFLFTIARSTAVDLLRSSGKVLREAVALDDAPEVASSAADAPNPEEETMRSELQAVVRRFLDGLTDDDRRFAAERFIEGGSQEKAGAAVNLSRQEARTREAKIKRAFADYMAAQGWMEGEGVAARVAALLIMLGPAAALMETWP